MNDEVNQIPPKALCGFIQMDVCKYFLQRVSLPCICSALILEKKKSYVVNEDIQEKIDLLKYLSQNEICLYDMLL